MRKLASLRRIDAIFPIPNADAIECAQVGGWQVVVKKGEFLPGQLAVYFEIDSFIPSKLAPWLTKPGHEAKVYKDVYGERLRTVRLRKQLSQGLLLPICRGAFAAPNEAFIEVSNGYDHSVWTFPYEEDTDLTELLEIQLWEPPESGAPGERKGNFPHFIRKTDQERIQNLSRVLPKWIEEGHRFERTEKLDGSSMTVYCKIENEGDEQIPIIGVCSRNMDLVLNEANKFWKAALNQNLVNKLSDYCLTNNRSLALQGELIGESIQKNRYAVTGHWFYLYAIWDIDNQCYLLPADRQRISEGLDIDDVPTISESTQVFGMEGLLESAIGFTWFRNGVQREGDVYKSTTDPTVSFKVISNKYLEEVG
jgi:RNA ligase (TIGR02306 family)